MTKKNIKALLFDLGGVIIELDWKRAAKRFGLATDGGRPALEAIWNWEVFQRFERGELAEEDFRKLFSERLGLKISSTDFDHAWNGLIVGVVPGIEDLFPRFRVPAYAMTNTNPIHYQHVMGQIPVMNRFQRIYASHLMKRRKPEPEVFQKILTDLNLTPNEILFFDDLELNVKAALALGIPARLVKNPLQDLGAALAEHSLLGNGGKKSSKAG